ncbi:hypothetical protein LB503_012321 [Fusarium chuoi]|nr:hypothetical protein LB503_012321 [Fusarium chuoi]
MGILEVVQEERRSWLERKLLKQADDELNESQTSSGQTTPAASAASALLNGRSGITAQLLSKPNSRIQPRSYTQRRVLLCGDVVPIQKRNGATGSASLWVKEKKVGLIWVLEEIHEDVAYITLDEDGIVQQRDSFHGFPVKGLTLTQEKSTSLRFRGGDISPVLILPKSTCLAQLSKPVAS